MIGATRQVFIKGDLLSFLLVLDATLLVDGILLLQITQ
jgi:hypothetical protein